MSKNISHEGKVVDYKFPDKNFPYMIKTGKAVGSVSGMYHRHPEIMELQYIHKGSGMYFIRDRIYHFSENSLMIIHGDDIHAHLREENSHIETITKTTVMFSKKLFAKALKRNNNLLNSLFFPAETFKHKINLSGQDAAEFEMLLSLQEKEVECKRGFYSEAIVFSLLGSLAIVARVMEEDEKRSEESAKVHGVVERMLNFVDRRFKEDISLDDVAGYVNRTSWHASRLFKDKAGFSFKDYLNARRVVEAKRIIEVEPDDKLVSVAYKSGFASLSSFNKNFRKVTGISPSRYKEMCDFSA
jgi:AraC-like DNA-binding protein